MSGLEQEADSSQFGEVDQRRPELLQRSKAPLNRSLSDWSGLVPVPDDIDARLAESEERC